MSSTADVAGQKRVPRGLEDTMNKKKQKDRVNQESKEGRKVSSSDKNRDLSVTWKQNANEIIVKLKHGEGSLKTEDVHAAFTDSGCLVELPDGRQWSCSFHEEIEGSCSKVQYKEKGNFLQLILQKKIPFQIWPSLLRKKKLNDKEQEDVTARKENGKEKPSPSETCTGDEGKSLSAAETTERKRVKQEEGVKRANVLKGPEKSEPPVADAGLKNTAPPKAEEKKDASTEPTAKRATHVKAARVSKPAPDAECVVGERKDSSIEHGTAPTERRRDGRSAKVGPQGDGLAKSVTVIPTGTKPVDKNEIEVTEKETTPSTGQESKTALEKLPTDCTPIATPDEASAGRTVVSPVLLPAAELEGCGSAPVEQAGGVSSRDEGTSPKEDSSREKEAAVEELVGDPSPKDCPSETAAEVEKSNRSKEDSLEEQVKAPQPMVTVNYMNNSFYEKGSDFMVVNVYVKEILRETSKVLFREQDFTLIFQTSDPQFLRLHPDCGPNTLFRWQVKLRDLINPEQCTYNFTVVRIDVFLKKRRSQRWGGLEAPAAQGAVGGAKVAVPTGPTPLDKTQPGSGQHALPSKEEPRAGEKEKPQPEDGGLAGVAARTVSEHVPLKQEPHVTSPKPTCMVPPMTHSPTSSEHTEEEEEKKVCLPGFTGLVNLGNTCFMNSVIQSLSNTRELRDYFHDRSFETEINYSNPLGTGGRLAIGFAVLLRALWKGTHHAFQPSKLKAIVASKASQFTGYVQHDAQEFMAFLLDGLHEDLNRIQNKPYTETLDSDGRPDEVVAEEAWQRHKMRNDSFIVDLFQGQYKSKLHCPVCSKVSITFDPFLYLPVPLPQKQKVLTVFYFAKEPHKKPVKFLVSVSKENSSAAEIIDSISRSTRVKPENLWLAEVVKNIFQHPLVSSQSLDAISPSDLLFCFELLAKELAKEKVVVLKVHQRLQVSSIPISKCAACQKSQQPEEEKLKRCTRCYQVGYCNQTCQKNHWPDHKTQCKPENIGCPFLLSVPESRLTYSRLTQLLEGYSRYSVSVFQPPFQPGRLSPEQTAISRSDLRPPTSERQEASVKSCVPSSTEVGDGDREQEFKPIPSDSPSEPLLASCGPKPAESTASLSSGDKDSLLSRDSGYSERSKESWEESRAEKETSYEKSIKPEAAVPGYQHPVESSSCRSLQFFILAIDSANKEQKLEDKGDTPLELAEDGSLALVWKNNERAKEYVLVESKELEYEEDPGSASEAARAGHFTLEQCLNLFTKPEVLAPEEAWYCPKCKQHREASKQLMLWRLPNVLIIQLKRFSFRNFIWRDKINDMVDFPVRNLDLSKFCIGQKDSRQPPVYDLYAVINHYGGMIGGHYTAYARLPSDKNSQRSDVGWRLFDDSTVTAVDESQVATRCAYVLFYRRQNSPVERPSRTGAAAHGSEAATATEAASNQASLIRQELEAEEEEEARQPSYGRFRLYSTSAAGGGPRAEEDRLSDYSDEDCARYFVLGTMTAIFALFFSIFYPLVFRGHWV
ncbi:ubiquitin carboxyl-terminal hydrolase 19 isoform X3 [Latimeria chalumnae]|uniref:ubiquitin carboxyl-terminal hydrolase 19 isoform X3 n=1 Tax=Latimeria chalumnae TaxID=7897 RepID=UPI00313B9479